MFENEIYPQVPTSSRPKMHFMRKTKDKRKPAQLVIRDEYPRAICENCGHLNQLDFDPRHYGTLLIHYICKGCKEYGHWTHYYTMKEMVDLFGEVKYLRLFITQKFGSKHCHKKATSISL